MPWSGWKYYVSQTLLALAIVAIIAPGVIWCIKTIVTFVWGPLP